MVISVHGVNTFTLQGQLKSLHCDQAFTLYQCVKAMWTLHNRNGNEIFWFHTLRGVSLGIVTTAQQLGMAWWERKGDSVSLGVCLAPLWPGRKWATLWPSRRRRLPYPPTSASLNHSHHVKIQWLGENNLFTFTPNVQIYLSVGLRETRKRYDGGGGVGEWKSSVEANVERRHAKVVCVGE